MVPPEFSSVTSRRHFLKGSGLAATAAVLGTRAPAASAAPRAVVEDMRTISLQPQYYHGWPTVARRRNSDLVLVVSGGREGHICPFGRVEMMVSHDQGATWSWPQIILDSPSDDRDAGIVETAKGTLLATSFTSLAYEPLLLEAEKKQGQPAAWPEERLRAWQLAHTRLSAEERQAGLGEWMVRSTDGGVTWSARYPCAVSSPHGPIQLADGRLLYAGKQLWSGEKRIGVCQSTDDGLTWQWLAAIPARAGQNVANYHELHAGDAGGGRLIAHIRTSETLQSESTDGGQTWSEPHPIGADGFPSFLTRLRDGRLLMTYGHRSAPRGNQAQVSDDGGRTWSGPLVISSDGISGDLGYPSTVELDDGSLLTVWYELMKTPRAVLRQARWRIAA